MNILIVGGMTGARSLSMYLLEFCHAVMVIPETHILEGLDDLVFVLERPELEIPKLDEPELQAVFQTQHYFICKNVIFSNSNDFEEVSEKANHQKEKEKLQRIRCRDPTYHRPPERATLAVFLFTYSIFHPKV